MTKNNLNEHLAWFLRCRPTIPALDYISALPAYNHATDVAQALRSVKAVAVSQPSNEVQIPAPKQTENEESKGSNHDMARLQFPPSTGKKPRMLSQLKTTPTETVKAASTPTVKSRKDDAPIRCSRSNPQTTELKISARPGLTTERLETPYKDDIFDQFGSVLDIDEIDLTQWSEGHTSSSATAETFGQAVRIWQEDSALRAEPLPKKSTKRTSDEYSRDMLSPSQERKSAKKRRKDQCNSLIRECTSACNRSHSQDGDVHCHSEQPKLEAATLNAHVPQNPGCVLQHAMPQENSKDLSTGQAQTSNPLSKPVIQRTNESSGSEVDRAAVRKVEALASIGSTHAARIGQGVVQDSEDEDVQEENVRIQERRKIDLDRSSHSIASRTAKVPSSSPTKSEHQSLSSGSKAEDLQIDQINKSPSQERSFPKDNRLSATLQTSYRNPPQSRIAENLSGSKVPSHCLSRVTSNFVRSFLDLPLSFGDALLCQLQAEAKDLHVLKNTKLRNGEQVPADFQRKLNATKQSLKAMEELVELRDSHRAVFARKGQLVEQALKILHTDVEPDQEDELLATRKEVLVCLNNLKEHESKIIDCLNQGIISHRIWSALQDGDGGLEILSQSDRSHAGNVLIASTQIHRPRVEAPSHKGSPQRSVEKQSKGIWQSPLSSDQKENLPPTHDEPAVSSKKAIENDCHFPRESPHRVTHAQTALPSPVSHERQTSRSPTKGHKQIQVPAITGQRPFKRLDEELGFSRRMRSPSAPFSISEDFDHADDEIDLLGAAEEADQMDDQQGSAIPPQESSRSALHEISGNMPTRSTSQTGLQLSTQIPQLQHPWSKAVKSALRDRFHLHGFRHNQLEAINATLAGKDAFVLMPTGGGKSLCYQLPAVVQCGRTRGVTVVISPLLSLMQDQVDALQSKGVQACLINSEVCLDDRRAVFQALRGPDVEQYVQILYITPEMISKSDALTDIFHQLHRNEKLARLVIDEAHCVSQWGHDFRPDYKALGDVRRQFPGVPVIALTATATENVKVDVIHNLGMVGCEIFTQSFNRPNLTYEIRRKKKDVLSDIASTIKTRHRRQSGIIYCTSRNTCERYAATLSEQYGIKARHYHAKMEAQDKQDVQKQWQAGKCNVIVATIAFGMGIDKSDVRFIIHQAIPKSLEGYYQETGRAGRDGKRSECYLYYGYSDTTVLQKMIKDGDGSWEQKERQLQMLRNVVQFCENKSDCRRVQILAYFNEHFDRGKCNAGCDNCKSGSVFESRDFTEYAGSAIKIVRQVQEQKVTLLHCVDIFRGSRSKKITELQHDEVDGHGAGSRLERGDAERLFHRLVSEEALTEVNKVNKFNFASQYVRVGRNAAAFSSGRRRMNIQVRISPNGKSKDRKDRGTKPAASDTGVGTFDDDRYPASTNVSSPLQAATKKRLVRKAAMPRLTEDSSEGEDEVPAFEPVRDRGKTVPNRERPLGPPITTDDRLLLLNPTHRHVLDDFMQHAKKECSTIMLQKGLRSQPFSDATLREMGINFPLTTAKMLEIDGIDQDKVERYGVRLLRLIKDAHNTYEALMRAQEDVPDDPNHQNVVEISDDNHEPAQALNESDDHEFSDDETSQYFQLAPEVAACHSECKSLTEHEIQSMLTNTSSIEKPTPCWRTKERAIFS